MSRGEGPYQLGKILFTEQEIDRRVMQLGQEISRFYGATPLVAVGVLKGAVFFLADLVRQIESPLSYDFFQVTSYGASTSPEHPPQIRLTTLSPLKGRHVLLVEDIVDTGGTLHAVRSEILGQEPASLRIVAFLDKRERRRHEVAIDWVGFHIPDRFVVGYGMDYDERFRNLPYLAFLER